MYDLTSAIGYYGFFAVLIYMLYLSGRWVWRRFK